MKKTAILLSFLLALYFSGSARAQVITACRDSVEHGYNFWLYTPEGYTEAPDSVKRKTPLILFLHGGSLVWKSLDRACKYGTIDAIKRGQRINAIVIQPQSFGKEHGYRSTWNTDRLTSILDWAEDHVPFDTDRLYVLGMSTGGYGTLEFTYCNPDRVAAAMALCGGSYRNDFGNLDQVPLWLIHGSADALVPMSRSKEIYNWLKEHKSGKRVRLDIMEGYNHSKLCRFFYVPMTYDWLFSHSLADDDRNVDTTFTITPSVIGRAYMDVDPEFKKTLKIIDKPQDK